MYIYVDTCGTYGLLSRGNLAHRCRRLPKYWEGHTPAAPYVTCQSHMPTPTTTPTPTPTPTPSPSPTPTPTHTWGGKQRVLTASSFCTPSSCRQPADPHVGGDVLSEAVDPVHHTRAAGATPV